MPLPAALVPAYAAAVSAAPAAMSVAPVAGVALLSFGMIATHTPDTVQLAGKPEIAAECIRQNVVSLNTKLAATVQPLYGTEVMAVVLKRGVASPPLFSVTLLESESGSTANYKALQPDPVQDLVAKVFAGC